MHLTQKESPHACQHSPRVPRPTRPDHPDPVRNLASGAGDPTVADLYSRFFAATASAYTNAERLSIFTEATDALDKAATAEDLALSARLAAGSAMESATAAFDTDWGKLVRALRAMVDAAVFETVVPRFVSKTPADSGEEG